MAIKLLPEHEAIVGKQPVAKQSSGRIQIRPEDADVLAGKLPPPVVPVPKQPEVQEPSLFQKAKQALSKGADFVVDQGKQAIERGRIKEPQFKAAVGEGLTPEQTKKAQESIKQNIESDPILQSYEDIKLPFIDAGITYNKNTQNPAMLTDIIKSTVEAPEKLGRTITEIPGLTKFTDERGGDPMYQVPSYGEKATKLTNHFLDKGYSYSTSVLLGAGLTGAELVGDASVFGGFLFNGAEKATGKVAGAITADELRTAHEFLGSPKTLAEAEANWRALQKQFHPDINGGNDAISKQLNQAISILRKEGIPDGRIAGIVDSRPTKKPEVKMIGDKPVENVEKPVIASVPEVKPTTEVPATVEKPKSDNINVVAENIAETSKKENLGYDPMKQIKLSSGEIVKRPENIVSRTQLQGLLKTLEKDEIVLKVDDNKNLTYEEPGKREITIKSSALGLITDRLPTGANVKVTRGALGIKGTAKETALRGVDDFGNVVAKEYNPSTVKPATTPEELKHRIEQLNKFAQQQAILRKPGGLPKNAAGIFRSGTKLPKQGQVNLQKNVIANDRQYMETLAHELGHALENGLTGTTNTMTRKVFGNITDAEWNTIRKELRAVTHDLVGEETAKGKASYYYQNTEMLARFFEKHFASPGNLEELAPTAVEALKKSAVENPIIQRYLEAVEGSIDEGQMKRHLFFSDMKQTYQNVLGKRVGTMAWNDEVRYRAMKERAKILIEQFVKEKFKNVKDDPAALFDAVESIKVTEKGEPVFGTRNFEYVDDLAEAKALEDSGYEIIKDPNGDPVMEFVDGKSKVRIAKSRFTPEQGKAIFDSLSPEGKQLVKDFTAARNEAVDYFNREVIKDVHKIESNIEGWVHHYWEDGAKGGIGRDKLSQKIASARKMRTGESGYVKDLQKAMTKSLTELETEKAYNSFINDYFARISKPIAEGALPDKGWVEVVGDIKKGGVGTKYENRTSILKDGKMVGIQKTRYQVPEPIYERFKMIREVAKEAGTATRVVNSINRYWKVNILFHPGSASTNFLSGGIQYSSKVLTDFYKEILTGDITMAQTRRNLNAMLTVLTPKGWNKAPDWIYGADLSNNYGQFSMDKAPGIKALDKSVDFYGDRVLKLYGAVERYWKKVITTAENGTRLDGLNQVTKEGLRLPTQEEKDILDMINSEVDLFAYDYDNVPVALDAYNKNFIGQAFKPFLKYPYKFAKHVTTMMEGAVDRTLPWQTRLSYIMTLSTMASAYAYYRSKKQEEQETPEVPESAPASLSTRGRLFVDKDEKGNEIFTRVSKYPFINLTEAGLQFTEGNSNQAWQSIQDMIGGVGPIGDIALALMGYSNEYDKYTPFEVRAGKVAGSFLPGTRILSDIAKFFDPYQRKQETFAQGITSVLPLPANDEATLEKLRGKIKTVDIYIEGGVENTNEEGSRRTTITRYVENYKQDILMGLLFGIYQTRIDPEEAEAYVIRKEKNEEKKKAKE